MKLKLIVTDDVISFGSVGYRAEGVKFNWTKQVLFYYNEFLNKVVVLNDDYKPRILNSHIKICKRLKIIPEIRNEPI